MKEQRTYRPQHGPMVDSNTGKICNGYNDYVPVADLKGWGDKRYQPPYTVVGDPDEIDAYQRRVKPICAEMLPKFRDLACGFDQATGLLDAAFIVNLQWEERGTVDTYHARHLTHFVTLFPPEG